MSLCAFPKMPHTVLSPGGEVPQRCSWSHHTVLNPGCTLKSLGALRNTARGPNLRILMHVRVFILWLATTRKILPYGKQPPKILSVYWLGKS